MLPRRTRLCSFMLCFCLLAFACSTRPPHAPELPPDSTPEFPPDPPPEFPPALLDRAGPARAVAVVPARYRPESSVVVEISDPVPGRVESALVGAARGAVLPLQLLSDPYSMPAAIALMPGTALIGLVAGAYSGRSGITPPESAAAIEGLVGERLDELRMSEATAHIVAASIGRTGLLRGEVLSDAGPLSAELAPDYRALADRGFGAVLEVRVRRVAFTRAGGSDPRLALVVTADARLLDAELGTPVASRRFAYQSPMYEGTRWVQEQGKLVGAEFSRSRLVLGERIVESLLLGTEWSALQPVGGPLRNVDYCGLPPVAPLWAGILSEMVVESMSPTIRWAAFPLAEWVESDDRLGAAESVRYELRIWEASAEGALGGPIYERYDLLSPSHQVERELPADTAYFWSVRARYVLEGVPRATRWSAEQYPLFQRSEELVVAATDPGIERDRVRSAVCDAGSHPDENIGWMPCVCLDFIPVMNYFRFRTPTRESSTARAE